MVGCPSINTYYTDRHSPGPQTAMSAIIEVGHFQTLDLSSPSEVVVDDAIHGRFAITEPVLVELLRDSAALRRLVGVRQHGISSLLGLTPCHITRFEHSVGALLLVRRVGGSLAEQVAALLHDLAHTAMSHVVDYALTEPGGRSFHEEHKMRFVHGATDIPAVLARHGFADLRPLDEEQYPLVELAAPRLCADRLDYGLRDAVGFGKLALADARRVLAALRACPDARDTSPRRVLALRDRDAALMLARAYMACDRDVWGNPGHGDVYARTAELMASAIRGGLVREAELWELSDRAFWERLRGALDAPGRAAMARLEAEGLPTTTATTTTTKKNGGGGGGEGEEDGGCGDGGGGGEDGGGDLPLPLPRRAKIRTIDPDVVCGDDDGEVIPLSVLVPGYAAEREEYIRARTALYA
ncbi:hypothetical protein GGR56DRAFT_660303 [Xylariaceae sp. FL0804]|nr:hypothetical protein GGR56DRAFT_660303 [Xylariaceae sp. FL0804]